jgi:hypothetical protein
MNWKKKSKKQEKTIAKGIGGKRQPGSGCFDGFKGDVENADILGECKTTGKKSFTITMEILNKIEDEAMGKGKEPRLYIRFESMPFLYTKDWELRPFKGQE